MKDANLNKTIKFIDKKAEYKDKNRKTKLAEKRLKLKDHSIIKYEERKKSKEKNKERKKSILWPKNGQRLRDCIIYKKKKLKIVQYINHERK